MLTSVLSFAIALLGVLGIARADEVRVTKQRGVYSVPVEINGAITLPFIVDSGATEVHIPVDVVTTLVRAGTITFSDFLPGATFQLADGTTVESPRFVLRSLRVGRRVVS